MTNIQTLQIRQCVYQALNDKGEEVHVTLTIDKHGRETINSMLDLIDKSDMITNVECIGNRIVKVLKVDGKVIEMTKCLISMDQTMVISFEHMGSVVKLQLEVSNPVHRVAAKKKKNAFEMALG